MPNDILQDSIDAMLDPATSQAEILEIGRMVSEGAFPHVPDADPSPVIPEAAACVQSWAHERATKAANEKAEAREQTRRLGELLEGQSDDNGPSVRTRMARKPTTASVPAKQEQPSIVINVPPQQESAAMLKVASLGGDDHGHR